MNTREIAAGLILAAAATGAQAAAVTTWQLADFNSDGLMSDFRFYAAPTGSSGNKFGPTGELCGASACAPIAFGGATQGINTFTQGFNFGGLGTMFQPYTFGAGMVADITGATLTFTQLNFGGTYGTANFDLPPDNYAGITSTVTPLGGNDYGVVVTYVSTINDPSSAFDGYAANIRLEGMICKLSGCGNTVPSIPEPETYAMLLAGLALVGVATRRRKQNKA